MATEPMVRNVPRGRCAITKSPMGHIPRGSQVIVIKAINGFKDPMVEIEFCGRVAWARRSDLRLLRKDFEV